MKTYGMNQTSYLFIYNLKIVIFGSFFSRYPGKKEGEEIRLQLITVTKTCIHDVTYF